MSSDTSEESWLQLGTVITGNSSSYTVEKILGEGGFGTVARCRNVDTNNVVAVKVHHDRYTKYGKAEVRALSKLRKLDVDKHNLIRFIDHFEHEGRVCLTFEILDISLSDFLIKRRWEPLRVTEIRVITQQLLVALEGLKSIGLVHTDIKLNNVMLVNSRYQPLRVKLIDLGCATKLSKMWKLDIIGIVGHRAPEVILGLPLAEAVDMWALGSIIITLFLGTYLYPSDCEYDQLRMIVQVHGQPNHEVLKAGEKVKNYFIESDHNFGPTWKLKTPDEYERDTGERVWVGNYSKLTSLDGLRTFNRRHMLKGEEHDKEAFISLLKRMLRVDPKKRITPSKALQHRFITKEHLSSTTCDEAYLALVHFVEKSCRLGEAPDKRSLYPTEAPCWEGASESENDTEGWAGASLDKVPSSRRTYIVQGESGSEDRTPAFTDRQEKISLLDKVPSSRRTYTVQSEGGTEARTTAFTDQQEKISLLDQVPSSRRTYTVQSEGGTEARTTAFTDQQEKISLLDKVPSSRRTYTVQSEGGTEARTTAFTDQQEKISLLDKVPSSRRTYTVQSEGGTEARTTAFTDRQGKIPIIPPPFDKPSGFYEDTSRKRNKSVAQTSNICEDRPPQKEAFTSKILAAQDNHEETNQKAPIDPSDFAEVKTKKKHFRRIRKFFSRVFKFFVCGGGNVD